MIGVVKRWNADSGYGFVALEGVKELAFLHRHALVNGPPSVGDRIECEVERTDKGLRCTGWCAVLMPESAVEADS